ncbi:MAG: twin-arginine translocase subunit TatC [Lentimonas sp.]
MSGKDDKDDQLPDPDETSPSEDEVRENAEPNREDDSPKSEEYDYEKDHAELESLGAYPGNTPEDDEETSQYCDEYHDGYVDDYEAQLEAEAEARREAGMSFLEHLEEFRWTVGRSVLAFFVGAFVVAIFLREVGEFLQMPLLTAYGSVEEMEKNLITYRPMGVISVLFQVVLLGGLSLSMPFVLYFLGAFIAPGLTAKEQKILRPSCFAAFILFLTGIAFAFFVILPLTLAFTVRLNQFMGFELFWAASDYYNMVVWFSLMTGAFFQFPLLIVILVYLQVIRVSKLQMVRKGVFVAIMVFSALMSPGGDFISLPITTGFMYGLYELAIWVGLRIERKKEAQVTADIDS